MMNIKRILCPINLSPDSDKALRYAAAIARAYKAKLFVCYCAEELVGVGASYRPLPHQEIKEVAQRAIGLDAAETTDLDWESIILEDNSPAEAITLEAGTRGIDLIVMCSRRRPLRAALLGSTTESVYRTAPCPVLVLHPDQREWATAGESNTVALKRVLVAHDFSDYSELALRQALSLAQEYQAELHLLHVLNMPLLGEPEIAWIPSSTEGAYHKAVRALQKAVHGEAHLWCEVRHAVRWGKPYREILNYAEEHEIDLICMGSQGTGFGMQTLFGSNVDRVIRQSPCPALVARPLRPTLAPPSMLSNYVEHKILADDPFQVLDREGVAQLIQLGTARGRSVKPKLKVGICGEHGGEPRSIAFCHEVGLDYVSCSPFRVPVARLAAAQAALAAEPSD